MGPPSPCCPIWAPAQTRGPQAGAPRHLQSALPLPVSLCPLPSLGLLLSRAPKSLARGLAPSPLYHLLTWAQARDAGTHRGGGQAPQGSAGSPPEAPSGAACGFHGTICQGLRLGLPTSGWEATTRGAWGFTSILGGMISHMRASCSPPFLSPNGSQQGFLLFAQVGLGKEGQPQPVPAEGWKAQPLPVRTPPSPVRPGTGWEAVPGPAQGGRGTVGTTGQAHWLCHLSRCVRSWAVPWLARP